MNPILHLDNETDELSKYHLLNETTESDVLYKDELYEVSVGLLVLLSIFYGTISILAVIGNSLVIWIVATTRQMQTVTNMFIANLALADVVIGMFAIPFQFQAAVLQRWNLPEFMCAFCPYVQMVTVNVSVFTLTAIAVDRHRAIINPLRARPPKYVCKIVITLIWIVSLLFGIPIAISLEVIQVTDERIIDGKLIRYTRPFCDVTGLSRDFMQHYRYYIVFVQYVIPFCVISFVYIQMAIRLWGSKTPGNAQDTRDLTLMRNKKRVIKMLIIVVLLFGICWFPLQLYNILQVTWESVNEYRYINLIFFCSDWLAMSNSCYNPFIYGIYNEKFKREFRRRFSVFRVKYEPPDVSDQTVSIYTRASSVRSICAASSTMRLKSISHHHHHLHHHHHHRNSNSTAAISQPTTPTIEHQIGTGGEDVFTSEKQDLLALTSTPTEAWIQTAISVVDQLKNPSTQVVPKYFHCGDENKIRSHYQPIATEPTVVCEHCDQHLKAADAAIVPSDHIIRHESSSTTSSSFNIRCSENHFCYIKTPHSIHCCNDCIEL